MHGLTKGVLASKDGCGPKKAYLSFLVIASKSSGVTIAHRWPSCPCDDANIVSCSHCSQPFVIIGINQDILLSPKFDCLCSTYLRIDQ